MANRILIIEDSMDINDVLAEYLNASGYDTVQAFDGIEGVAKFNEGISLIICDVMMPNLDGYSVVEKIRKISDVPIIMLTALTDEEDVLKGYDLGVDEYVSKPFSPRIFAKKVEAILARNVRTTDKQVIHKGVMSISFPHRSVYVNDETIKLSKKEFELVGLFIENEGIVFSRNSLLDHIWGYDYFGNDRVVDTAIKRLRKKLKEAGEYIITEHGVGYKFEVHV